MSEAGNIFSSTRLSQDSPGRITSRLGSFKPLWLRVLQLGIPATQAAPALFMHFLKSFASRLTLYQCVARRLDELLFNYDGSFKKAVLAIRKTAFDGNDFGLEESSIQSIELHVRNWLETLEDLAVGVVQDDVINATFNDRHFVSRCRNFEQQLEISIRSVQQLQLPEGWDAETEYEIIPGWRPTDGHGTLVPKSDSSEQSRNSHLESGDNGSFHRPEVDQTSFSGVDNVNHYNSQSAHAPSSAGHLHHAPYPHHGSRDSAAASHPRTVHVDGSTDLQQRDQGHWGNWELDIVFPNWQDINATARFAERLPASDVEYQTFIRRDGGQLAMSFMSAGSRSMRIWREER